MATRIDSGTPLQSYGGKTVQVQRVTVTLRIGHLPPHLYAVYVPLIAEYILGVDVLYCLTMQIK